MATEQNKWRRSSALRWSRLIVCGLLSIVAAGFSTSSVAAPCSEGVEITRSFNNGAGWEFCWHTRAESGPTLTNIFFITRSGTRRQVIKTIGLAALDVSMLDSGSVISHVQSVGIGRAQRTLATSDCPGGSVVASGTANACLAVRPRGYASKHYSTAVQGQALVLSAASSLSSGNYVHRFALADDGSLVAQLGHAGDLVNRTANSQLGWPVVQPGITSEIATAFSVNALWRMDMHLGASANNDAVEVIEAVPSADRLTKTTVVSAMTREFAVRIDANRKRTWRVVDRDTLNSNSQPISYELAPVESGQVLRNPQRINWSDNDIYATRYRSCETTTPAISAGCSGSLPAYVNGESIDRADVVLWYRTTLYRLPASEDRGTQRMKFMGFALSPRDWMARDGN